MKIHEFFMHWSKKASEWMGASVSFMFVFTLTVIWLIGGIFFYGFSDSYQMPLNTFSSITTMLLAFLIQGTQNRDAKALQLKLDELLLAQQNARKDLIDLEDCSDAEIKAIEKEFDCIRKETHGGKK